MAYGLNAGLDFSKTMGSTNIIRYRVVRLTSGNVIIHTTGPSTAGVAATTRRAYGVVQDGPRSFPSTQGKYELPVRAIGWSKVQASTKAIKAGALLTHSSGAVGTTTYLGGCVKASTAATQDVIGFALTSQAATATPGLIAAFLHAVR